MEEAKTLSQQQQQQLLLFQQLQQQQQKQQAAISRFPSNIDSHLGLHRSNLPPQQQQQQQQQNQMNQSPNLSAQKQQKQQQSQNPNTANLQQQQQSQNPNAANLQQQQQSQNPNAANLQQQQQKEIRPGNQIELQMAYQDAWRVYSVCEDVFSEKPEESMNRCVGPPYLRERIFYRTLKLLPYHVVADYEAEEDDRILDSDTTGQMLSRSQQWDHNIAAKVAEFTATFEKQVYAFNLISRKRRIGDFRAEERLMIEQVLLQEEKRGLLEVKTEIESREKAGREAHEAKLRAMVQAERARAESQSHAEMMARAPLRSSALGSQGSDIHDMSELDRGVNPDEMVNGWGNRGQRDEKEPSDDFLNDEETENGDTAQDDWHDVGEFDLNTQ